MPYNTAMEKTLQNILGEIRRTTAPLAPDALDRIIRARNREVAGPVRYVAKKKLLPFYQEAKEHRPERWRTWGVSPAEEALLVRTLQVKPRRTASGVATVTVLTKPWPCSSACLYCPNDVRMPKSYLHDEPACQRAERNWFDPYLQVTARLRTLHQMGHVTDKVELIVLGGTWSDYPEAYQIWYMHELFRALNDMGCEATVERESETRAIPKRRHSQRTRRPCRLGLRSASPRHRRRCLLQRNGSKPIRLRNPRGRFPLAHPNG